MRKTRRDNFIVNNLIYVIVGILVIVLLVLILGKLFGSSDKRGADGQMVDASIDVGKVKNELKKDTVPQIKELIEQYYTAMSSCDVTTLEQIVSDISDDDRDIIRRKKDYIEGYNNVTAYSMLSPVEGCYLVFAGYDIKFKNEDTLVPGLETFYVKTSKDGSLYIFKGDRKKLEKEAQDFIEEQLASAKIKALFSDVNDRYVDALASSPTLLSFIEGFEGSNELVEKAKEKAKKLQAKATDKPSKTEKPPASEKPDATEEPTEEPTQDPVQEPTPEPTQNATDTVLITANVNLRSGNDEGAERLTTMIVGDQATRISITDNGWSKVQYNGMEGYVKSDYVSTFKITSDTVRPTTTINVRLEASETANMAGQCSPDTSMTRYAVCDNGWSQVEFNGGVGYVKTEFLTN